ncbi:tautomerase family protein [Priestia aryabhattai]|uniref:tautomerase family protein n=1 Tax=Priestia megaterium TaxID=1404 RepID=UPI0039B9B4BB
MPVMNINVWEGFSEETKQKWVKGLTDLTVDLLNMPPDKVTVILHDVPQYNWAQAGTIATDPEFLGKSRNTVIPQKEFK